MTTTKLAPVPYLLSRIVGGKVKNNGKTIGRLADMLMTEQNVLPEVTHILVHRSFGYKPLMLPWDQIISLAEDGTCLVDLPALEPFEGEPEEKEIRLRDHLLDKRVLDCEDAEVEIVYDIKLEAKNDRLYITGVDCSRAAFLRRIGLHWLGNLICKIAASLTDDSIPWTCVQPLPSDMGRFKGDVKLNVIKSQLSEINPVDLADMLEELEHEQRMELFRALDTEKASDTLEEIDPRVQREMVASMPIDRAVELVDDMSPAQAADLLAALPAADSDAILEKIDVIEREKVRSLLEKHDDRIADFASAYYISFPPETPVGSVVTNFRHAAKDADVVMYIYVTSPSGALIGVVDIKELLQAEPESQLGDIMVANVVTIDAEETVGQAAKLFARYGFRALPVTRGEDDHMTGVIPFRDLVLAQRLV